MQEIEGASEFDIGFPMSFLGGPGGVKGPNDVWLMAIGGKQQHVAAPSVRIPRLLAILNLLTYFRPLVQ